MDNLKSYTNLITGHANAMNASVTGYYVRPGGKVDHDVPDTLEALRHLEALERLTLQIEAELVQRARRDGATWQRIGDVFGISRQAAQQRFS